jgi:uncharacterized membrane protein YhaH (DUF805 family)
MNFSEAIKSAFSNYFNFADRSSRSAFWYWVLFTFLVGVGLTLVDAMIFGLDSYTPLSGLFGLATFIPGIAVAVRRLHDMGRTGWWMLLLFLPLIGIIVLIIWWCQPSEPGPNQYGSAPLAALPQAA